MSEVVSELRFLQLEMILRSPRPGFIDYIEREELEILRRRLDWLWANIPESPEPDEKSLQLIARQPGRAPTVYLQLFCYE